MSHLTGLPLIGQDLYNQSATPLHRLGQLALDEYGNKYRYAKAGGTALVTGNLLQEPAEDTQFVSMAVPAAVAIGETEITVTNGTTTVTDGMFNEGTLVISVTPGIGQQFRIVSHTTGTSGASITYTVDRPYNGVIQYPASTQTGGAVGVALYAMTASYYGWIQTGGDCVVTFDTGTNSANGASAIAPSAAVAGSVAPVLDAVGAIVIGFSRQVASVDSTCSIAHLQID